jgi:hypothetical protein
VHVIRPEVRIALRVGAKLRQQRFEFSTPYLGEILPRRAAGGSFVQVHRDLELSPHPLTESMGERYAVLHSGVLERDERNHVRCTDTRVLACMLAEVDPVARFANSGERRFHSAFHGRDERDHGAVVRLIRGNIEYGDAAHRGDRVPDCGDDFRPSAL